MRFVYPALGAVIVALLFIDLYFLSRPALEFDLPRPSRPNPLQVHTPTPASTPEMTSAPALAPAVETETAVEEQAAPEVSAKIEPAARSAMAQAPLMKKRVITSKQRHRQNELWSLDADSFIRYVFFGR